MFSRTCSTRCSNAARSSTFAELPGFVVVPDQRACSFDGKVFAARRRHHIIKINRDHEIAHVFGPKQSDRLASLDHSHGIKFHGFLPSLGLPLIDAASHPESSSHP